MKLRHAAALALATLAGCSYAKPTGWQIMWPPTSAENFNQWKPNAPLSQWSTVMPGADPYPIVPYSTQEACEDGINALQTADRRAGDHPIPLDNLSMLRCIRTDDPSLKPN